MIWAGYKTHPKQLFTGLRDGRRPVAVLLPSFDGALLQVWRMPFLTVLPVFD